MVSGSRQRGLDPCTEEVLDPVKYKGSVVDRVNLSAQETGRELLCQAL